MTDIELSDIFDVSHLPDPLKHPKRLKAKAIWDTGATGSCITPKLASDLGLTQTGVINSQGAHGPPTACPTYHVCFWLPNKVVYPAVKVSAIDGLGNFDALIGMDVISAGDFTVTGKAGETVMSFRVPHGEPVDFVAKPNPGPINLPPTLGANDPCHCGSGKKYKKCHRHLDELAHKR